MKNKIIENNRRPFGDGKELYRLVARSLRGSEENDMVLFQEPHCVSDHYNVVDWHSIMPPSPGPTSASLLPQRKASFLSLTVSFKEPSWAESVVNMCYNTKIPFLGQASAAFRDEGSQTWHTLEKARTYAWDAENTSESLEYLACGPAGIGFHAYSSLDEYCVPHLGREALAKRNSDQTLTRYQPMHAEEPGKATEKGNNLTRPLIIVPQAFIWVIDELLVISLPVPIPESFWSLLGSFKDLKGKEIIGLLLRALVEAFDPVRSSDAPRPSLSDQSHKHQNIFKVFSRSIAFVSDQVSRYVDDKGVDSIDLASEQNFVHQIQDIREEISMIQSVIIQQEEVWRAFVSTAWPEFWVEGQGLTMTKSPQPGDNPPEKLQEGLFEAIEKPRQLFRSFKTRLQRLDDTAARVERSVEIGLDLKQKHASLREARRATLMSASVIGFTLITAIFTPLSFMVSLFALPIDRFQTSKIGSGDDAYYTTNYIGKWIGTSPKAQLVLSRSSRDSMRRARHPVCDCIGHGYCSDVDLGDETSDVAQAHQGV